MAYFLFYCLLMPVAWLPLGVLYVVADLLWPILFHVVRYRRKVVDQNLQNSFPQMSRRERHAIARKYYRHLADLLAEGIYNLRATPPKIAKHYRITNREVVDAYYERGESVILMSAHYNNWEYMVSGLGFLLRHHGVGVGKPLSQKNFGVYLTAKRTRYGTEVVDQTNVRETFAFYEQNHVPTVYMMLSDQSPNDVHKCVWLPFLNQDTPFIYGAEYFARKYNLPVLFYEVRKERRGHYAITFSPLCPHPAEVPQYDIVKTYAQRLEALILEAPQYWLWSHRRWKHKRPTE